MPFPHEAILGFNFFSALVIWGNASTCAEKIFLEMPHMDKIQGCRNQGGRGGNCPPAFAEISPKLLENKGFSFKVLFFAPPLLVSAPLLVDKFQHP